MPNLSKLDREVAKEMGAKARRRFVRTLQTERKKALENPVRRDLGREHAKKIFERLEVWASHHDCEARMGDYGRRGDNPMGVRFQVSIGKPKKKTPRKTLYTQSFSGTRLANRKPKDMIREIIAHLDDLFIRR